MPMLGQMDEFRMEEYEVPEDQPLPFGKEPVPHVVAGYDAFPLRLFVIKPYPQRNLSLEEWICNYR